MDAGMLQVMMMQGKNPTLLSGNTQTKVEGNEGFQSILASLAVSGEVSVNGLSSEVIVDASAVLQKLIECLLKGGDTSEVMELAQNLPQEEKESLIKMLDTLISTLEKVYENTEISKDDLINMLIDVFKKDDDESKVPEELIAQIAQMIFPDNNKATAIINSSEVNITNVTNIIVENKAETTQTVQPPQTNVTSENTQGQQTVKASEIKSALQDFSSELKVTTQKPTEQQIISEVKVETNQLSNELLTKSNTAKFSLLSEKIVVKTDELNEISVALDKPVEAITPILNNVKTEALSIPQNVQNQISDRITSQINSTDLATGETKMTMILKPESLGEITVSITKSEGGVVVKLSVALDSTKAIIQERLPQLISSLQTVNPEIKSVELTQSSQFNMSSGNFSGNGFSNPDSNNKQPQQNSSSYVKTTSQSDEEVKKALKEGELWQIA